MTMTKVISLKLAKRLAPYLENVETENWYFNWDLNWLFKWRFVPEHDHWEIIKTLTLEEAIEFLKQRRINLCLTIKHNNEYWKDYNLELFSFDRWLNVEWDTQIEAIEKMIEYLLDNNLLWKKN